MHRVAGAPLGKMVAEVWPSAIAATVAALIVLPIEVFVVHAASHGFLLSFVLLAVEALAYALIYVGLLRLIAPQTGRELIAAGRGVAGRIAALRRPNPAAA
jgi:hypothetical protein